MATVIRAWRIEADKPIEIHELSAGEQGLLEKRLEDWLAVQPDAIRDNLLVIGRQVWTGTGPLDLLCITGEGSLVVVELKRDKAPREAVAQAIDYASWIGEQNPDEIARIARDYLGRPLDEVFREKFGAALPEIDPLNLSVIVVASRLDAATERMIQFLSRHYEMDIDGLIFRYIQSAEGDELLIRTSVVSEERQAARSQRGGRLEPEVLMALAEDRGAAAIVRALRKLGDFLLETSERTYGGSFRYWASGRMLCGVNVAANWGAPAGAIDVWVSYGHWAQSYGLDEMEILKTLRSQPEVKHYPGSKQLVVRMMSVAEAERLVATLATWAGNDQRDDDEQL